MASAPPPVHQAVSEHTLKEWEKGEDLATNFNDLLMRIRTFGLPFIGTAIGAGSILGTDQPQLTVPWWIPSASAAIGALALIASVVQLWRRGTTIERLRPSLWELSAWLLIAASAASWAVLLGLERSESFSFSAPVLAFGGILLFVIYLLDRFYYSALLIGAVTRIEAIENQTGLQLSREITQATPRWTYTLLPTALYLMPVLSRKHRPCGHDVQRSFNIAPRTLPLANERAIIYPRRCVQ